MISKPHRFENWVAGGSRDPEKVKPGVQDLRMPRSAASLRPTLIDSEGLFKEALAVVVRAPGRRIQVLNPGIWSEKIG